jgi:hypothetical protein
MKHSVKVEKEHLILYDWHAGFLGLAVFRDKER